jgi:O-antigen/teichoic acid export membrane protein
VINNTVSANRRLVKTTIIYMIGQMTSKLFQFLILPLITSVLLTEEYGMYDLVVATTSLVIPLVTLQTTEALFRFVLKAAEKEKKLIISTVVQYSLLVIVLMGLAFLFIKWVGGIIDYPLYIFGYVALMIGYNLYGKFSRAVGDNFAFAVSGVIYTIVMLAVQLVAVYYFKMRVEGMLLSNIAACFVAIIYIEFRCKMHKYISFNIFSFNMLKDIFKFSLPLVPNSICWWFVSACNRYIISICIGIGANGIFTVSNKFAQVLAVGVAVFQMAWQESAILESDNKAKQKFYNKTFDMYFTFLMTLTLVAMPIFKIAFPYMVDESYLSGMYIIPILLASTLMSSFSQFYGVGYYTASKTIGAFTTTVIAAGVNCTLTIALIWRFGLFAPAIGSLFAFLIQWLMRIRQMKAYFHINLNISKILFLSCCYLVVSVSYYMDSVLVQAFMVGASCVFFLLMNKKLLLGILSLANSKVMRE